LEKHNAISSSAIASRRCELSLAITSDPVSRLVSQLKVDFVLNCSFDIGGQEVVANDPPTAKKDQLTAKLRGLKWDPYNFFTSRRSYLVIEIKHLDPNEGRHITQANPTIRAFGAPHRNCTSDLALYAIGTYAVAIAAGGTDRKQ
jgi:hypothetical protein